jgi:hypothetical protein
MHAHRDQYTRDRGVRPIAGCNIELRRAEES